jgi:hypothetical protein
MYAQLQNNATTTTKRPISTAIVDCKGNEYSEANSQQRTLIGFGARLSRLQVRLNQGGRRSVRVSRPCSQTLGTRSPPSCVLCMFRTDDTIRAAVALLFVRRSLVACFLATR